MDNLICNLVFVWYNNDDEEYIKFSQLLSINQFCVDSLTNGTIITESTWVPHFMYVCVCVCQQFKLTFQHDAKTKVINTHTHTHKHRHALTHFGRFLFFVQLCVSTSHVLTWAHSLWWHQNELIWLIKFF